MTDRENWINEILNSTDGLTHATARADMYDSVAARMQNSKGRVVYITRKTAWSMAAGVALLIGVNVLSIVHYNKQESTTSKTSTNPLATEYFSYINNI